MLTRLTPSMAHTTSQCCAGSGGLVVAAGRHGCAAHGAPCACHLQRRHAIHTNRCDQHKQMRSTQTDAIHTNRCDQHKQMRSTQADAINTNRCDPHKQMHAAPVRTGAHSPLFLCPRRFGFVALFVPRHGYVSVPPALCRSSHRILWSNSIACSGSKWCCRCCSAAVARRPLAATQPTRRPSSGVLSLCDTLQLRVSDRIRSL